MADDKGLDSSETAPKRMDVVLGVPSHALFEVTAPDGKQAIIAVNIGTHFVSGPCQITAEQFAEHYSKRLTHLIKYEIPVIVAESEGVDLMTQQFLADRHYPHVTVYHIGEKPRHNVGGWPTVGGFRGNEDRDSAMTYASECDVLWLRSEEETKAAVGAKYKPGRISGTQRNSERRREKDERKNQNQNLIGRAQRLGKTSSAGPLHIAITYKSSKK